MGVEELKESDPTETSNAPTWYGRLGSGVAGFFVGLLLMAYAIEILADNIVQPIMGKIGAELSALAYGGIWATLFLISIALVIWMGMLLRGFAEWQATKTGIGIAIALIALSGVVRAANGFVQIVSSDVTKQVKTECLQQQRILIGPSVSSAEITEFCSCTSAILGAELRSHEVRERFKKDPLAQWAVKRVQQARMDCGAAGILARSTADNFRDSLPLDIGDGVTIDEIKADGEYLSMAYRLSDISLSELPDKESLKVNAQAWAKDALCEEEKFRSILDIGVQIRLDFFDKNGNELVNFGLNAADCEKEASTGPEEDFSLVWTPIRRDHEIALKINATDTIHLPIFLNSTDLFEFNKSGAINITPETLTIGILLGLQDDPPTLDVQIIKNAATDVFTMLPEAMGYSDQESLILDVSATIREDYGLWRSRQALLTGIFLEPTSDKIKSDYVSSCWFVMEEDKEWDEVLLSEIVEVGREISKGNIKKEVIPLISYILAIAKYKIDGQQDEEFWESALEAVGPYPELAGRLQDLREGAPAEFEKLSLSDMTWAT